MMNKKAYKKYHIVLIFFVILLFSYFCTTQEKVTDEFYRQRRLMVEYQLVARGIKDSLVLKAMEMVERHKFVPDEYLSYAYDDQPIPIGEGQTISQPYIVAYMTEVLQLDSSKKVLEIGTGSGYQAAVLAEICKEVYSVELIESLSLNAKSVVEKLGYRNIFFKTGDGYKGWVEHSPYDAIIVTCSPSKIPESLTEQLAENGKLIIPVGADYIQELVLVEKKNGELTQQKVLPVRFVPMLNQDGTKY
ncbi:MAG: protein-L-isoaspartate(D-aspartate) O-methyltransferase [Bacteroidales bacterium]|nr:protein-L-isoaspartate(D-aspartate) O-methyltransferase [Bacteroidales bacterium]